MKAIIINKVFLVNFFSRTKLESVVIFALSVYDSNYKNKKYFTSKLNRELYKKKF